MRIKPHGPPWWIVDTPADYGGNVGPYDTRAEARDDLAGLRDTEASLDDRGFFTTARPKHKDLLA